MSESPTEQHGVVLLFILLHYFFATFNHSNLVNLIDSSGEVKCHIFLLKLKKDQRKALHLVTARCTILITHVESLFHLYLLNEVSASCQGVQNRTFVQHRLIIMFTYRFTSILGNKKFCGNTDPERQSDLLSAPTGSSHLAPA